MNQSFKKLRRIYSFLTNPPEARRGIKIFRALNGSVVFQPGLEWINSIVPSPVRFFSEQYQLMKNPFLCLKDDVLFCFFGTQRRNQPGKINVVTIGANRKIRVSECHLDADCHFSFPFVYAEDDGRCYMIPETAALREVAIYEPTHFPFRWNKKKVLLNGHFIDSHLLFFEGVYYLFTTQVTESDFSNAPHYQLNIFYSDTLAGNYTPHPCNPVCTDQKYSRSGGKILNESGLVYRVAHDCSGPESGELHFLRIAKLTKDAYEEEFWLDNWAKRSLPAKSGAHHIDLIDTPTDVYTAVDVTCPDSYLQRFAELLGL